MRAQNRAIRRKSVQITPRRNCRDGKPFNYVMDGDLPGLLHQLQYLAPTSLRQKTRIVGVHHTECSVVAVYGRVNVYLRLFSIVSLNAYVFFLFCLRVVSFLWYKLPITSGALPMKNVSQLAIPVAVLTFLLCASSFVAGQGTDLGTIRGTVTDASGAVVPSANVTILDTRTGARSEERRVGKECRWRRSPDH